MFGFGAKKRRRRRHYGGALKGAGMSAFFLYPQADWYAAKFGPKLKRGAASLGSRMRGARGRAAGAAGEAAEVAEVAVL